MLDDWILSPIAVILVVLFAVVSLGLSPPADRDSNAQFEHAKVLEGYGQTNRGEQGVKRSRTFTVIYRATLRDIPASASAVDLWLPWPQTDINQTIHRVTVEAPGPITIGREARFGNQCLHVSIKPPDGNIAVSLDIEATRMENSGSTEPLREEDRAPLHLAPEPLVPLSGPVKEASALEATRGLTADSDKARAILRTKSPE